MSYTKAQEIASWYQSPGPAGIGFAVFASSGNVTPELWENIRATERQAAEFPADKFPEYKDWAGDMKRLRELLEADGIKERPPFAAVGTATVLAGAYIPAHDETFDLAESIGEQLDEFRAHIAKERDAKQADAAVTELLKAFLAANGS